MPTSLRVGPVVVLSVGLLAGCPPPDPQPGGSAPYTRSLGDDPDFSDPDSRIQSRSSFDWNETSLQGAFAEGPAPRAHGESERIGNCRLMTYTPTPCDPVCGDGDQCIDGECVGWPDRVDRGDLLWTWPDGEQTVEPDDLFGYYATGAASTAGDVTIEVDGLVLTAPTIDGPEPVGAWDQAVATRGPGDATLRWSNPIEDARVRLHMTDCVGSHGGFAAAEIECEGPDTGELVLPDAFLTALEAGDWSRGECGSHTFDRYHAAAPEGAPGTRFETIGPGGFFYFP